MFRSCGSPIVPCPPPETKSGHSVLEMDMGCNDDGDDQLYLYLVPLS